MPFRTCHDDQMDRTVLKPPDCGAVIVCRFPGGASGAPVWRAVLDEREVVVKRVQARERVALRLLASLDDPVLPRVLAAGRDEHGEWLVMPFHSGAPCGLVATPPAEVFSTLGRVHAEFVSCDLPVEFERLDERFVVHSLRDFGGRAWDDARSLVGERSKHRAAMLTERMLDDQGFRRLGEHMRATFLHGDFYGLNVHLPGPQDASPLVIDWGCARIGPAMFDVAMVVGWDSDERRAHDGAWATATGRFPDSEEARLSHAWARALTQVMFAPVVALRGAPDSASDMVDGAERAWQEYRRLVG